MEGNAMKFTQKQVERELERYLNISGIGYRDHGNQWIITREGMRRLARHVLRRIAAAERRGFAKGVKAKVWGMPSKRIRAKRKNDGIFHLPP
jgi:hypothetical protein